MTLGMHDGGAELRRQTLSAKASQRLLWSSESFASLLFACLPRPGDFTIGVDNVDADATLRDEPLKLKSY